MAGGKELFFAAILYFAIGRLNRSLRVWVDLDGTIFAYNCCMRLAYVISATRIVSSNSGVLHHYDSRIQHEKCRRIFKHALRP